jgi:hypothetical protein
MVGYCSPKMLAPISAYLVLYSTDIMGKDRLGRLYLVMANRAVDKYALCWRASTEQKEGKLSDTDKVINNAVWGIFNAATYGLTPTLARSSTYHIQD